MKDDGRQHPTKTRGLFEQHDAMAQRRLGPVPGQCAQASVRVRHAEIAAEVGEAEAEEFVRQETDTYQRGCREAEQMFREDEDADLPFAH